MTKISFFSVTTDYETTVYRIFGIPVWKVFNIFDITTNTAAEKHYLFCLLPLIKTVSEYEPESEFVSLD